MASNTTGDNSNNKRAGGTDAQSMGNAPYMNSMPTEDTYDIGRDDRQTCFYDATGQMRMKPSGSSAQPDASGSSPGE